MERGLDAYNYLEGHFPPTAALPTNACGTIRKLTVSFVFHTRVLILKKTVIRSSFLNESVPLVHFKCTQQNCYTCSNIVKHALNEIRRAVYKFSNRHTFFTLKGYVTTA